MKEIARQNARTNLDHILILHFACNLFCKKPNNLENCKISCTRKHSDVRKRGQNEYSLRMRRFIGISVGKCRLYKAVWRIPKSIAMAREKMFIARN